MRDISTEQVQRRLAVENPWWEEPHQVASHFAGWTPRPYLDLFFPLLESRDVRRAVVLMGPRRVGKTVMIHHAIQRLLGHGTSPDRILYVSVDHPLYNGLALERFLDLHRQANGVDLGSAGGYVFFDEIQYLRDWERHLKALVDTYPRLRCVASGSAAAALRLKSTESGAGRFTDFLLPPLTFYEYLELVGEGGLVDVDARGRPEVADLRRLNERFFHYLNVGGYPEAVLSAEIQADPARFIKGDIIDKVLLRDLPSLYGIRDVQELNALFTTLAFNTAGEVSLEELAKRSGVTKNTLKRYIEYLEAAFLIRVVHRVDRRGRRFQRATSFKVYLTNPSMRSALFAPVTPEDPAAGAMVETGVFAQWFHWPGTLHYARWKGGEVDLVRLSRGDQPALAIEVKWSDRPWTRPSELSSLVGFCKANGLERAAVTTRERSGMKTVDGVTIQFSPASLDCWLAGFAVLEMRRLLIDEVGEKGPGADMMASVFAR